MVGAAHEIAVLASERIERAVVEHDLARPALGMAASQAPAHPDAHARLPPADRFGPPGHEEEQPAPDRVLEGAEPIHVAVYKTSHRWQYYAMRIFSFRPSLTLRGRTFKGLRGWAGKPFHPPLTDVPIGCYVAAAVFDVISVVGGTHTWARELYRAGPLTLAV